MKQQIPAVGRIVHYVSHGTPVRDDGTQAFTAQCRAAIITAVPGPNDPLPEGGVPKVGLFVINPTGVFLNQDCAYDKGADKGGTWHWPEVEG